MVLAAGAAGAAALGALPAMAQQAPAPPAPLSPGPGASGSNATVVGHVDSPIGGAPVSPNGTIGVVGWADDEQAQGWSGFDQVELTNGPIDQGGTVLGQGTVGLPRQDVAQGLTNAGAATAGFQVTVANNAALASASGTTPLYVYLHSPSRGWWYLPMTVFVSASPFVQNQVVQNGLVVSAAWYQASNVTPQPLQGATITNLKGTLIVGGYAFDTNSLATPGDGIQSVHVYVDGLPGNAASVDLGLAQLNDNAGATPPQGYPSNSGFALLINTSAWPAAPANATPNQMLWPTGAHTMYFVATGTGGQTATTSVSFITSQDNDLP